MTADQRALLDKWQRRVQRAQIAHYAMVNSRNRLHLWIGLPIVILSTLSATAAFSDAATMYPYAGILASIVSVIVAILAGVQTFLKVQEQAAMHLAAAKDFANLKREIEQTIAFPPANENGLKAFVDDVRRRWDELNKKAPPAPSKLWANSESKTETSASAGTS